MLVLFTLAVALSGLTWIVSTIVYLGCKLFRRRRAYRRIVAADFVYSRARRLRWPCVTSRADEQSHRLKRPMMRGSPMRSIPARPATRLRSCRVDSSHVEIAIKLLQQDQSSTAADSAAHCLVETVRNWQLHEQQARRRRPSRIIVRKPSHT